MKKIITKHLMLLFLAIGIAVFSPLNLMEGHATEYPVIGTCGDNLTWSLSKTGTLTISGTGDMKDYNTAGADMSTDWNGPPWGKYQSKIKKACFKRGYYFHR